MIGVGSGACTGSTVIGWSERSASLIISAGGVGSAGRMIEAPGGPEAPDSNQITGQHSLFQWVEVSGGWRRPAEVGGTLRPQSITDGSLSAGIRFGRALARIRWVVDFFPKFSKVV